MDTIIAAAAGLIAGLVGSLIAPWVQWAVETRRSKLTYRREQVEQWREVIEKHDHENSDFTDTAAYSAIRPDLDKKVIHDLESGRVHYSTRRGSGSGSWKKYALLDEVARIERKWNLV